MPTAIASGTRRPTDSAAAHAHRLEPAAKQPADGASYAGRPARVFSSGGGSARRLQHRAWRSPVVGAHAHRRGSRRRRRPRVPRRTGRAGGGARGYRERRVACAVERALVGASRLGQRLAGGERLPRGQSSPIAGKTAALLWQRRLDARTQGAVALAADCVYVPLADGRIVALRVATGEPLWERRLGGTPSDILAPTIGSSSDRTTTTSTTSGRATESWSGACATGGDVVGLPVVDDRSVLFRLAGQPVARP